MFTLAEIFTDKMVLQRNKEIRIFGEADEIVKINFNGKTFEAELSNGKWIARIPEMKEGGPYSLEIIGKDKKIVLSDILIGDVYLASGQSNMEYPLFCDLRGIEMAKTANNNNIRLFTMSRRTYPKKHYYTWHFEVLRTEQKPWEYSSEETALHFSAIGYFVAKLINEKTNVPIGIISANCGGKPIEVFVPEKAFEKEYFKPYYDNYMSSKISGDEAELYAEKCIEHNVKVYENENVFALDNVINMETENAYKEHEGVLGKLKGLPPCKYNPRTPAVLYDNMIAKIAPFNVNAVLWYQGESNVGINSDLYYDKFRDLVMYWREDFQDENLPFYTVEIAPYGHPEEKSIHCAKLRRQQWIASEKIKNCHIITTGDLGDKYNIHPNRKFEVAKRLANQILAYSYGFDIYCESPSYDYHKISNSKIYIKLKNDDGLYGVLDNEYIKIAGKDNVFVPANAVLEDGYLVVWSDDVKEPLNVRFYYQAYFERCRLYNKAGLPAAPFTTETN